MLTRKMVMESNASAAMMVLHLEEETNGYH